MKLTHNTKLKPGMTLIELTVVILVLLTLISVLFIGAQAYKNAADRSACILNIRNYHQGVRAYQNTANKTVEVDNIDTDEIVGIGKFVEAEPLCPKDDGSYALVQATFPAVGTAAVYCVNTGDATGQSDDSAVHAPEKVAGW